MADSRSRPFTLARGRREPNGQPAAHPPVAARRNRPAHVCISVHDVAPATWPACLRLLAMLDRFAPLPLTFLVVPDYHRRGRIDADPQFRRAIEQRLSRGDEVALHGYYHLDESAPARSPLDWFRRRMMTDGEGEFAALSRDDARVRLEQGSDLLRRLDWPASGFVAPAWLLSTGSRQALGDFTFAYTTTRTGIFRLPDWHFTLSPAVAYSVRSKLRRQGSLAMNALQMAVLRQSALLRLSLHPVDAEHEDVMAQWQRIIASVLTTHGPVTKAAWATGESHTGVL